MPVPQRRTRFPRGDDDTGEQGGQKVSIQSQRTKGEPVSGFFAERMGSVEVANHVRRAAAAGHQQDALRVEAGEPAPQTRAEVRQVVQAAADLDDGGVASTLAQDQVEPQQPLGWPGVPKCSASSGWPASARASHRAK